MDQLATILQARGETKQKEKELLKSTISDISHQLKTPLAALTMYQEIIAGEPENPDTVKEFSAKMGVSLKRTCELKVFNKRITLPYGCMLSYSCQTKKDKNHTKELLHV